MRSIIKFIIMSLITMLIPILIREIAYRIGLDGMAILIAQILIIAIFVWLFTLLFKFQDKYDNKTIDLIKESDNKEELIKLRDERKTFKSKEEVTYEIADKYFSEEELANLKKYANTKEDMDHYYALAIKNADREKRSEIKIRRDNFNKRFKNKIIIYPDYNENLRTSVRWLIFFFINAAIYNICGRFIKNPDILAIFMFVGMLFVFAIMVNTIIWIIRTLKSYRVKDYI